jgi:hypothetical protein
MWTALLTTVLLCAAPAAPDLEPASTTTSVDPGAPNLPLIGGLTLGSGVALLAGSAGFFVWGNNVEGELRGAIHPRAQADGLLMQRTVAGSFAWTTLVIGIVGVAGGLTALLWQPAPEAVTGATP